MLIDFRQLFPKYGITPTGVLHVGANVGEEATVYLELGIKKQVWIEANPEICMKLADNVENNERATIFNFAAGDLEDVVQLHVSNNGSQSSSVLELGTHLQQHPDVHYVKDIQVPMRRLDSFTRGEFNGCDFLNMDIQGAELMALRGAGELLKQFKWIYLEVNKAEVYKGCAQVEEIDLFLSEFLFTRVETKWVGNWGDALYIRK